MTVVLVVDDFADNRMLYACYLEFCGHKALEAADGEEAVRIAHDSVPDVIVMDLSIPGIDGWEATRMVKADPRTRHVPVIALSGHVLSPHEDRAAQVGADAFLGKPCDPETLVAKIAEVLAAVAEPAERRCLTELVPST